MALATTARHHTRLLPRSWALVGFVCLMALGLAIGMMIPKPDPANAQAVVLAATSSEAAGCTRDVNSGTAYDLLYRGVHFPHVGWIRLTWDPNNRNRYCITNQSGSQTRGVSKQMYVEIGAKGTDGVIRVRDTDSCWCKYWAGGVATTLKPGERLYVGGSTTFKGKQYTRWVVTTLRYKK